MTIPLQSDATYNHSIYVDTANKITATKPYQFKKSQVFPEEALKEACGKIRTLFILMKILMILSHHHIAVPVQLQQHRNFLPCMNCVHYLIMNTIPCHTGNSLIAFHQASISRRQVEYFVDHTESLIVLVIVTKPIPFSLRNQ